MTLLLAGEQSRRDLVSRRLRTSERMLSIAMRNSLVAALVLSGAVAGCLGDDGGADRSGDGRPTSTTGAFRELKKRPLDLPSVDLRGRSIREYGTAGRCWQHGAPEVGAIALPAIPGEAALGPWPGLAAIKRGPVYAALLAGPPRIVLLSGVPAIGGSSWRPVRTLWISRPSYGGPVLARGGRLDRPGGLGFGSRARPRRELRLPAGSWPQSRTPPRRRGEPPPQGWRVAAVPTRIRAPGCYAFQVDGLGFSYVLAFGVQGH
jgi:hypothetical protein